jgi:hypothetical protein
MKKIKNVISVCHSPRLKTWMYVSRNIEKYIDSENYYVIVPENEVPLFKELSPPSFQVVSENSLIPGLTLGYVWQRLPENYRNRAGWYFQQILKIVALFVLPSEDDDLLLIWDADAVPVHNLGFCDEAGKVFFFTGAEYHRPYFEAIRKLTGFEKKVDFSFIAQCFPIYKKWAKEFVSFIEAKNQKGLVDAVLEVACLAGDPGFSEYETMGTFLVETHYSEIGVNVSPWERFGLSKYGSIEAVYNSETEGREFAHVTFESWDQPSSAQNKRVDEPLGDKLARPQTPSEFLDVYFCGFKGKKCVVQVGANDGVMDDPLRRYLSNPANDDVLVTLIEPLDYYFQKLAVLYRDRKNTFLFKAACGSREDIRDFYYVAPKMASQMNGTGPANDWAHRQGSFSRESAEYWIRANQFRGEEYRANIDMYLDSILQTKVVVQPLRNIRMESADSLFVLDVQGAERDVLLGIDWFNPPHWLLFEQDRGQSRDIFILLGALGYELVCSDNETVVFGKCGLVGARFAPS